MTEGRPDVVRAAGGVLWRRPDDGQEGALEVLVVHRPRYDDWSLPKGKADPGESDEDCALREVEEETGLICELGPHLSDVSYVDQKGRPKVARYWAMQPRSGQFTPTQEVDEIKWLPVADALATLSRRDDARVVETLVDTID